MAPSKVLRWHPCPLGLPALVTVADVLVVLRLLGTLPHFPRNDFGNPSCVWALGFFMQIAAHGRMGSILQGFLDTTRFRHSSVAV